MLKCSKRSLVCGPHTLSAENPRLRPGVEFGAERRFILFSHYAWQHKVWPTTGTEPADRDAGLSLVTYRERANAHIARVSRGRRLIDPSERER